MKSRQLIRHFWVALIFFTFAGCASTPDPLAGWKRDSRHGANDEVIERDYDNYIKDLPARRAGFVGSVDWLEDGAGQRAVDIKIGRNGIWWEHVLFYDKNNKRIRVIVFKNGGYRS